MTNDLISREALIKAVEDLYEYAELDEVLDVIKAAPTVELTETEIQKVLNKRCMSAVANEYLIALHGKRPRGKWIYIQYDGNPQIGNWHCSECRQIAPVDYFGHSIKSKYCPNCGAKMREEANDETN